MASDLYVNPDTGDDGNVGCQAAPFATLQKAANVVSQHPSSVRGVWTIHLSAGTYTETVVVRSMTRSNQPIDIRGPSVSNSAGNTVAITFATLTASGTFQASETVTGGTSGATATVKSVSTGYLFATVTSGSFEAAERITGRTSAATCVADSISPRPTAIIQPASTGDTIFTVSEGRNWFRLIDVRFTGATTGRAGDLVSGVRVGLSNVHVDACRSGWLYEHNSMLGVNGGVWIGRGKAVSGGVGAQGLYASTHSISSSTAAEALHVFAYATGLLIQEGTQGHLDFTQIADCGTGLRLFRGAGSCNTDSVRIRRCDVGVLAQTSHWYNNNIIFGEGSDENAVNARTSGGAPEYDYRASDFSSLTLRLQETAFSLSHTGTTASTALWEPNSAFIRKWLVSEGGHISKFRLCGEPDLIGTCTISVFLDDGWTDDLLGSAVIPAGTTAYSLEITVHFSSSSAQLADIVILSNGETPVVALGDGAIDLKNRSADLRINATLSSSSDVMRAKVAEYYTTLGG